MRNYTSEEVASWPEGTKRCFSCKEVLSFSEFHKEKKSIFGLNASCKKCRRTKSKSHYEGQSIEYRIYSRAKSRSAKNGRAFEISIDDIEVPEVCPILGIKLISGIDIFTDASPSIDRIDSTRGYVKGNIRIISNRANRIKSNATVEDLEKILQYMREGV